MTRTVIAKSAGFYNGSLRDPGTVFEVSDNIKDGKWFEDAAIAKQKPPVLTTNKNAQGTKDGKPAKTAADKRTPKPGITTPTALSRIAPEQVAPSTDDMASLV